MASCVRMHIPGPASAPQASLQGMSEEILHHILSFHPVSVSVLQTASPEFKKAGQVFLRFYAEEIIQMCSRKDAVLSQVICRRFGESTESDRDVSWHLSLFRTIGSFGLTAPRQSARILTVEEIAFRMDEVQEIQDHNLQKIWLRIRATVLEKHPQQEGILDEEVCASEIRMWMHNNPLLLQEMTSLNLWGLGLTTVPVETGLCTGLESLNLACNQLGTLPEGVFQGLGRLLNLQLFGNQLEAVPEGLFWGLERLQTLGLGNNRLGFLPQMLFRGLAGLYELKLHGNRLAWLPEGLFLGLAHLGELSLDDNQLLSIPAAEIMRLPSLNKVTLGGNHRLLISWNWFAFAEEDADNSYEVCTFVNYACQTDLARLCQLAAGGSPRRAVIEAFARLPNEMKNAIYGMIWVEAGRPDTADHQWGETHAFDHMRIFTGALQSYVSGRYVSLQPHEKEAVFPKVTRLAQRVPDPVYPYYSYMDPVNWGKEHACDNVLRLIDAIILPIV